jgi:dTDP-4-amino-4,6-dideoxygalactose transaminase
MIPVMRPWLGAEEAAAVAEVVNSGWVAQGPRVAAFEQAFASAVGAPHAVAVSSCTAGLHLALICSGVAPGDEVIVPSLSFIATANAVRYVGGQPIFADVDDDTGNLTAKCVEPVLTSATKAVLLVHQAGVPADLADLRQLCEPRGIRIVEDAACAIGSTYDGKPIGAGSELAVFSFHPRKLLTTGEGGMVVTTNAEWAAKMRRLREHGMSVSAAERHQSKQPVLEQYLETGFNYRMTDLQAALGLVQLRRLDEMVTRRRELALRYQDRLSSVVGLQMVHDPAWGTTNYQSFWILLPDDFPLARNALLELLAQQGISARRGIMAAHLEPAYSGSGPWELPVTERLTHRSLVLPLFHEMTEEDHDRVVQAVLAGAGQHGS